MAAHMSNKDRIAKLAAEKEAERREKAEKKPAVKKKKASRAKAKAKGDGTTTRSGSRTAGRLMAVWLVCDQAGAAVKSFPWPQKGDAAAEAAKLTESKGKPHFVKQDKVPME